MERVNDARTPHDSNDDTQDAKMFVAGNRSPGASMTKSDLSLTVPFKAYNEDVDHKTPPVTPGPWTEASNPIETGVLPVPQQLSPLPPAPPEAGDSAGVYGRVKRDPIGEKGSHRSRVPNYGFDWERNPSRLQSYGERQHAAGGRPSRSHDEIREVVADAVNPAQDCGRAVALGEEKSREDSCGQVTRTHSRIDRGRDAIFAEEVTLPGPSFIQNLARNDFHNGRSEPLEIESAERGIPNHVVDSKEKEVGGVHTSALNHDFLHSSNDGSTAGFADDEGKHEYVAIVDGRGEGSGGSLPQGEAGSPYIRIENPENQETRDDGTGVDHVDLNRVCEGTKHIRGEAAKNELPHRKNWEGWLDDSEDIEDEEFSSQSNAESLTQEDLPDPRLFRQSGDFERRRSSLYSVHFGKGSLLGEAGQAMSRSLLPTTNENRTRLIQTGAPSTSKPFSSHEMTRAQAITSEMLAEKGERQESIKSIHNLTVQTLANHEAAVSSLSRANTSRWHRGDKPISVLRTPVSSEEEVERGRENTGATQDTLSAFSSMSSRGCSSGGSSGIHDLLEELGGSDIEKVDRNNATEETERATAMHGNGEGKRCGDPSLPMGPLDTEDITSLANNHKLREAMLLVDDLHFGKLPLMRQVELLRDVSTVHFAKGEVIFSEGELSDALYFMLDRTDSISDTLPSKGWRRASGTSKLVISGKDSGEGEEYRLREFVPSGRIFGEEGLIYSSKHKRCSTIRAAADMSCAVIRAPAFPNWWEFRLSLLMKKVAMLSQLSTVIRIKILHALKYANFQPGKTIVRQGEPGERFYIITRGTAIVSTKTSRYSSLASSTSEDDTDADISADASFDAGIPSTSTFKSYTTFRPRPGEEHAREHAGDREDSVTSVESIKGGGCGDSSNRVATNVKSQPEPSDRAVRELDVVPKSMLSLELSPPSIDAGEQILTRLHEGDTFGEMALLYEDPRTATVRAVTEVTCLFLEKDAFRTCLHDKAFHKLMEQATLQRVCYREQREGTFRKQLGLTLGDELEVPQPAFSARTRRSMEWNARSSFRLTEKIVRKKDSSIGGSDHLVNDYRVCKKVGEGSYGAVYKVVNVLTSKVYAMKVVNKPSKSGEKLENFERALRREVSVMKVLRHPNVVTLWEVINDRRSRKVYMIQEFMERGPLLKEDLNIDPIPEEEAVAVFIQVTKGLQCIHSYGVCHGDIKPSNILVDHNGRAKIADFGSFVFLYQDEEHEDGKRDCGSSCGSSSKERRQTDVKNRSWRKRLVKRSGQRLDGTPGFQAPELFEDNGTSRISFASDVWALGVTLYQMVVGRMPFFGSSFRALMSAIKTEELTFPAGYLIEPYLVNLLRRMLRKNPATRITLEEATRHEWVKREGLWRPGLEGRTQKDAERFKMGASSARTSLGSALPKSPRRSSSPSRMTTVDPITINPQESRSPSLHMDASIGWNDDGQERNFSPRSIETLVDKRRSILPPGIIDDVQKIVLRKPNLSPEVRSGGGKEAAPTPQASNSNSGLPRAGMSSETSVLLGSSHQDAQEYPQPSSSVNKIDPPSLGEKLVGNEGRWSELQMSNLEQGKSSGLRPRSTPSPMWELQEQGQQQQESRMRHSQLFRLLPSASRKMSSPQLLGVSRRSWRESCTNGSTSGNLPTILRDELDDLMALERSQRLVRKPDFLMLKMDPTPMSNTWVVVSAKTGFGLLGPSTDRQVGSRRSSARHLGRPRHTTLRHSFGGFGSAPGVQQLLPFAPSGYGEVGPANKKCSYEERTLYASVLMDSSPVKFKQPLTRQDPARQSADDPRKFGSCDKQSLKGRSSDLDSSRRAAGLLFPVNTERARKGANAEAPKTAAADAVEDTVPSHKRVEVTTPYRTTSVEEGSGDELAPHEAEGKRCPEHARDASDACDIRTMVFTNPIRQTHLFTSPQDPMDCIDEEEPEEMRALPLDKSLPYRGLASDGEASKETGDSLSSLDGGFDRDTNKPSISRIRVDYGAEGSCHLNADGSAVDRSAKLMNSNGSAEELPYDSEESDAEDGQSNVSSSDDGLEEETSVADITDCLECIGEAWIERDDKEVSPLDYAEIQALTKGHHYRSWCSDSSGGGNAGAVSGPTAKVSHQPNEENFGHVQARTWGGQVNNQVGVRFGVSLNQGNLCFMEDTATCLADAFEHSWRMTANPPGVSLTSADTPLGASGATSGPSQGAAAYFAIFDGHGGADVAIHLQDALHQRVLSDPMFPSNIPEAISNGCKAIDLECLEIAHGKRVASSKEKNTSSLEAPTLKRQMSEQNFPGAVSVMAIVHRRSLTPPASFDDSSASWEGTANTSASDGTSSSASQYRPVFLHVANVGDCRAVLCRGGKAVALTEDHTPAVASEATRIEAAGGFISRCRVNGILGVSRSFGDIHCKVYPLGEGREDLWDGQQVISRPEVHSIEVTPADSFLILACDGVWGVMNNQQAVSFVHRKLLIHKDVQRAAVELIEKALEAPSYDNCSCVVVCFNQTAQVNKRSSRLSSGKSSGSIGSGRKDSASSTGSGVANGQRRGHT